MTTIEPGDIIHQAAQDLLKAFKNKQKHAPIDLSVEHVQALRQLSALLNIWTMIQRDNNKALSLRMNEQPILRVRRHSWTPHNHLTPQLWGYHVHRYKSINMTYAVILQCWQSKQPPPNMSTACKMQEIASLLMPQTRLPPEKTSKLPHYFSQDKNEDHTNCTQTANRYMQQWKQHNMHVSFHHMHFYRSPELCLESNTKILQCNWTTPTNNACQTICKCAVPTVTHETITKYQKLAKDPMLTDVWKKTMCKKWGWMAQGFADIPGKNTVVFIPHDKVKKIPNDTTSLMHALWLIINHKNRI